jgi:hypothetical protein
MGGLPGLGMYAAVVLGFDPGRKQPIQFGQVSDMVAAGDVGVAGDLGEELIVDGPEKSFYVTGQNLGACVVDVIFGVRWACHVEFC